MPSLEESKDLFLFERELQQQGFSLVAGLDEAGRGPLAGPVVAAACLFDPNCLIDYVDDSKKLSPRMRASIFNQVKSGSIEYGIGIIDAQTIDQVNIYQATLLAMQEALHALKTKPEALLIDAMPFQSPGLKSIPLIKGDSRSYSIALASIIAKETRDEIMLAYHEKWPAYHFNKHKGYGTKAHMAAIFEYGPCPIHRRSFEPLKSRFSF
ncbi:MAG: ribonuclease [Chlamydiales bacterium]|jgi:ribonuclease HII|nr:ribonuclease [Chlamydiales bacterium]